MADFDKIYIEGVPYTVKDSTTARTVEQHTTLLEQQGQTIAQQGQTITQHGETITQQGLTIAQQGAAIAQQGTKIEELENRKPSPFFNVKDYGAVGDGTTDDTAAIQNTMDAAMRDGGGTVVFPAGTYRTTSTLTIRPHTAAENPTSSQNIHFLQMDRVELVGLGEVTIKPDSNVSTALNCSDFSYPDNVGSYSNFYTVISNIRVIGTNAAPSTGIDIYNALHSIVQNCQVDGFTTAVSIRGYGEITVQDCTLRANKVCLYSAHAGDNLFIGNDFYSDSIMIQTYGYSGSTKIVANTFTRSTDSGSPKAIQILTTEGEQNGPYHIIANSFDQVITGVEAYGTATNHIQGVWVMQNKLTAAGLNNSMVLFTYADNCAVQNNTIPVQNDYDTVGYLGSAVNCANLLVEGNMVTKTRQTAIYATSCSGSVIANSFLGGTGSYISITNCNGLIVSGNLFKNNNSSAVNVVGSAGSFVINNTYVGYSSDPVPTKGSATVQTNTWWGAPA